MKKYIVKDGDTMWTISKTTGVRFNLLMAANPQVRDPNQLQPGSLIMIPELTKHQGTPEPSTGQPAKSTHHSAPNHKAGNHEVPPYFGFVWPHTVKPGETWEDIAKQYGISSAQLQHLNPKETPNTLDPGDTVFVPALGPIPGGTTSDTPVTHSPMPQPHHGGNFGQPGYPYPTPGGMPPSQGGQSMPPTTGGQGMTPAPGSAGGPGGPSGMPHYGGGQVPGAPSPWPTPGVPGTYPPSGWEQFGPHTHVPRYFEDYRYANPYWQYGQYEAFGGYPPSGYDVYAGTYGHSFYDNFADYPTDVRIMDDGDWDDESVPAWPSAWSEDVSIEHYDLSSEKTSKPDREND